MNIKSLLVYTLLLSLTFLEALEVGDSIVPQDKAYYKYKDFKNNIEILYTKDNLPFAKHTASIESPLHKDYKKFFGWELDETLYVGLISDYNQIANGFSSQWPNNRQINYVGGAMAVDYFSSTSWLDTLLYHESAHNYQLNVKGSVVSRSLHSIFGNGFVFIPVPMIVPNAMENSFLLEGNAVLNESWHGNGGRLYSGRFKAETLLQAKAGNIVSSDVYNVKLEFPYASIVYIQGAFYNLYMAQKYGLKKLNSYFKYHSEDFLWPQFTDASMKMAVGIDFETSLSDFAKEYAQLAQNLVEVEGVHIASSQFFSSLGNSKDEIFFITQESGVRTPELLIMNKKSQNLKNIRDSWIPGKAVKFEKKYYTQGSRHTSPLKIYQGLLNAQGFMKEGSESKVIQGYLSDEREVYFDVASSFLEPQLYVGDEFYTQVNSSVIIDKYDNLYYFKQNAKTRTLYKNRMPLFSYEGFYGIVSDVDSDGGIYFIANSELGSTLYAFKNAKVTRASLADNIVEARLINDEELLIAAISDKDYYYVKTAIEHKDELPFETKLFFENREYYGKNRENNSSYSNLDLNKSYFSVLEMHYSGSNISMVQTLDNSFAGSLNINFADPLSQNAASVFVNRDDSGIVLGGVNYVNTQYLLKYSLAAYGVLDDNDREDIRDNGFILSASLPFYQAGHYYGEFKGSYYQDYETLQREPLSVSASFARVENYGLSMYPNYLNKIKIYGVLEREDKILGMEYSFSHELPYEFYFGFGAKYSQTDSTTGLNGRGVKVTSTVYQADMDPSSINMPSLSTSAYVKSAGYGEINLSKVFNFSSYFFTFPISLQREALYAKYRRYEIEGFSGVKYTSNEMRVGLTLSTVYFNSFAVPLTLEYIHNDAEFIEDKNSVRLLFNTSF